MNIIMEQRYEIIKAKVDNAYERMKDAKKVLADCREECDHPKEHHEKCTDSWRPGAYINDATICGICGELLFGLPHFGEAIKEDD